MGRQPAAAFVQPNGKVRDLSNGGKTLDDFLRDPRASMLKRAHVLALRLYSSNSYPRVNDPLRQGVQPHPFPATTFYVYDACKKMRSRNADYAEATSPRVFWRGLRDVRVSDEVMQSGGAELGCFSTSESRSEALKWATPLLLKVVASDWLSWGVDISWLSMYGDEAEWLFPPLMYLNFKTETETADGVEVE